MGILHGRTMAISGVLAIVAAVASLCFKIEVRIIMAIAALLCAAVCLILFLCKKVGGFRLFSALIIVVIFICSLIRGYSFFDVECEKAKSLCGENLWIRGIVTDVGYSKGYFSYYDVIITEVNKEECNIKAKLCCEFSKKLSRGDGFSVKCETITSTIGEADSALYSVGDGVLLEAVAVESEKLYINSIGNTTPLMRLEDFNKALSDIITDNVDGEAGALASAMLLGNKELLSDSTVRDFRRSGMSHLLAVSGLHVSIIVGIVGFVLMKLRINRHVRNVLLMLFALAYMFVLGFSISAVRSVIMVCIVYLVYYLGDVADGVSSLGIAASIILLISPQSILDMGFVLSFSATLGIVVFMPLLQGIYLDILRWSTRKFKKKNKKNRMITSSIRAVLSVIYWFVGLFVSSFSAMLLTLLPISITFEQLALNSIESNFLSTFLVSPFLFFALVSIPVSLTFGTSGFVGDCVEFFGDRLMELARRLSLEESSVLSLENSLLKLVIAAVVAVVVVLMLINFKHKRWCLLLPMHYPVLILALVMLSGHVESDATSISVLSVKGDEQIVITKGYTSAIVDFSDGAYSDLYRSFSLVKQSGASVCSALVLTHYHKTHLSSVERLINNEVVEKLLLAKATTLEDFEIMEALYDMATDGGIDIFVYDEEDVLTLIDGVDVSLSLPVREENGRSVLNYFSATCGEERLFYIGESAWLSAGEGRERMLSLSGSTDVLLFGSHGEKCNQAPDMTFEGFEECVIFDEELLPFLLDSKSGAADGLRRAKQITVSPEIYVYTFD